jgi:Flp pilus assembly protein TadG
MAHVATRYSPHVRFSVHGSLLSDYGTKSIERIPRLSIAVSRVARHRGVAKLAHDRRGSVMIEFALVAIPFLMLIFGVLEVGIVFFGSSMLEKATADASRLIRTGQAQAQNMSAIQFHDYICTQVSPLLSCGTNLQVDVESFANFSTVNIGDPIKNGVLDPNLNNYSFGASGDIVLVRTFYTWNIITPLLRPFFANLGNGQRLLTSTSTFRNEPF